LVAGGADEFDVGGGDEYFWDVGIVVHVVCDSSSKLNRSRV
jgi:hypothetical protein